MLAPASEDAAGRQQMKGGPVRALAIAACSALCALLCVSAVSANPVVLWYIRDSPVAAPNGSWDDQWSGGLVSPEGEVVLPEDPGYDPDCGTYEAENTFAHVGSGQDVLSAYLDLGYVYATQVAGTVTASLCFRQTMREVAFVTVELYRVDAMGGNPEFLCADYAEIIADPWPPSCHFFVLGDVPETDMTGHLFRVDISSDGQNTDLVWDCTNWEGWIQLPESDPFNPVGDMSWSTIKALYR